MNSLLKCRLTHSMAFCQRSSNSRRFWAEPLHWPLQFSSSLPCPSGVGLCQTLSVGVFLSCYTQRLTTSPGHYCWPCKSKGHWRLSVSQCSRLTQPSECPLGEFTNLFRLNNVQGPLRRLRPSFIRNLGDKLNKLTNPKAHKNSKMVTFPIEIPQPHLIRMTNGLTGCHTGAKPFYHVSCFREGPHGDTTVKMSPGMAVFLVLLSPWAGFSTSQKLEELQNPETICVWSP